MLRSASLSIKYVMNSQSEYHVAIPSNYSEKIHSRLCFIGPLVQWHGTQFSFLCIFCSFRPFEVIRGDTKEI